MKFFKKYSILLLVIFFGGLLATWVWFAIDGIFSTGGMDKGVWLSFWGGFLAFFGTVFLGLVSIWQNENAYNISERMLKVEETKHVPVLDVEVVDKEILSPISKEQKEKLLAESVLKYGSCCIGESILEYSASGTQSYNFLFPRGEALENIKSKSCDVLRFSFKLINKGEATIKAIILHSAFISLDSYSAFGHRRGISNNKRTMIIPDRAFSIFISALIHDKNEECYSDNYRIFVDMAFVVKTLNDKYYLYTMQLHICNNVVVNSTYNCNEALERDTFGL